MALTLNDEKPDVLIAGGGPAGMSAALWCSELGLASLLVDRGEQLGGQLFDIHNPISNYIGELRSSGRDLRASFAASLKSANFAYRAKSHLTRVDVDPIRVTLASGEVIYPRALVAATGLSRRRLNVAGESEFTGAGIIDSGARDPAAAAGKAVAVIGGGDAAVENALILAEHAERVYLIHRRANLSARKEFVDRAIANVRITFMPECTVSAFTGSGTLSALLLKCRNADEELRVDLAIVRIGYRPNSELLRSIVKLDDQDYIIVDRHCATNVAGIYAAGDVACPASPTISTATGMGATAAKAAYAWLKS